MNPAKMLCNFCKGYTHYDWDRLPIIHYELECQSCHRTGLEWYGPKGATHADESNKYLDINEIYFYVKKEKEGI